MKRLLTLLCSLAAAATALAAAPALVNYQGRLTAETGAPLPDGVYRLAFGIYGEPVPGAPDPLIWGETQQVSLLDGRFNVLLGAPGAAPLPGAAVNDLRFAFTDPQRFLELRIVEDAAGSTVNRTILPRQQFVSVPYAMGIPGIIVDDIGQVGIGTIPHYQDADLHISRGVAGAQGATLRMEGASDGGSFVSIAGMMGSGSARGKIDIGRHFSNTSQGFMNFLVDNAGASGGNLVSGLFITGRGAGPTIGIGTTSPDLSVRLDVNGTSQMRALQVRQTDGQVKLVASANSNSGELALLGINGNNNILLRGTPENRNRGEILVLDENGGQRLGLRSRVSDRAGEILVSGAAGNLNVTLGAHPGAAATGNTGSVAVYDVNSLVKASMYVETNGVGWVKANFLQGSLVSPSDERLKQDIQPVQNALEMIRNLNGVSYSLKDSRGNNQTQLGFVAQELQKVVPEAVMPLADDSALAPAGTTPDDQPLLGVNYNSLIAVMVEALKEQQREIEVLRGQVEHLVQNAAVR